MPNVTESALKKALKLIEKRDEMVEKCLLLRNNVKRAEKPIKAVLYLEYRNDTEIPVLLDEAAFLALTRVYRAEIETLNKEIQGLGITTVDQEQEEACLAHNEAIMPDGPEVPTMHPMAQAIGV